MIKTILVGVYGALRNTAVTSNRTMIISLPNLGSDNKIDMHLQ